MTEGSRLGSLKVRLTLTLVLMTAVSLVVSSLVIIVRSWEEGKSDIETTAMSYAALVTEPIGVSYLTYADSGRAKFDEHIRELMNRSPDLERLKVVDTEGRVLFDSSPGEAVAGGLQRDRLADLDRLQAIQALEPSFQPAEEGDRGFEIVAPFIEAWGTHRLSMVYRFSYANLRARVQDRLTTLGGLIFLSILASLAVGIVLTARTTQPLEELTAGVQALARGDFGQRLDLRSPNEVKVLADAFNHMSSKIEHNLQQLEDSNRHLERDRRELEARNAELERFVYAVSHDLKTPLVTIRGFLGMARRDLPSGDTDQIEGSLDQIDRAAKRMAQVLRELLELSTVGRVAEPWQEICLGDLAREAVDLTAGAIAQRGVEVRIAEDLPKVLGERSRLLEVFQNLIENAIKFAGEQPRPLIEIGARSHEGRPIVYVRDNGIGIDPPYQEKVFGIFERLDASIDGTGIGLALVQRIIETHRGSIWVESKGAGSGSTFCFTLPRSAADGELDEEPARKDLEQVTS